MWNKSLIRVIVLVFLPSAVNCGHYNSTADMHEDASLSKRRQNISTTNNSSELIIKSIEFGAWWWSAEQLAAGIYRGEIPPPRNTYIKLERWQNIGEADTPHPDFIDVVISLENKGSQPMDLIVSAVGDFKIASFKSVTEGEDDEIFEKTPWTEENSIGQITVQNLTPGERREVKIENFNLGVVLEKYAAVNSGNDMWPWRFRVRVDVKNLNGEKVAQGATTLEIIPGD